MKQYDYRNPLDVQEALIAAENKRMITESATSATSSNPSKYTRLLFFDTLDAIKRMAFTYDGLDVIFIDKNSCKYNIKNNILCINDYENKSIKVDFSKDKENTVVYMKSGYMKNEMIYLCKKFITNNFIVLNNSDNVFISSDKYLTALLLDEYNINQPKYQLFDSSDCDKDDCSEFDKKLKLIYGNLNDDNKYVCKLLIGSGGTGVFICNGTNILSIMQCLFSIDKDIKILVQQKLSIKDGDIRAYVFTYNDKQEVVTCITRKKLNSDFRTNLSLGSTMEQYEMTPEQEKFVKNAAKCSGLLYCGIDACVNEDDNKLYVIEINGSPDAPVADALDDDTYKELEKKYYNKFTNILMNLINE